MSDGEMTARDRAEHIVTELDCDSCQYSHEVRKATTVYIAGQIRRAEQDAFRKGAEMMKNQTLELIGDCPPISYLPHQHDLCKGIAALIRSIQIPDLKSNSEHPPESNR